MNCPRAGRAISVGGCVSGWTRVTPRPPGRSRVILRLSKLSLFFHRARASIVARVSSGTFRRAAARTATTFFFYFFGFVLTCASWHIGVTHWITASGSPPRSEDAFTRHCPPTLSGPTGKKREKNALLYYNFYTSLMVSLWNLWFFLKIYLIDVWMTFNSFIKNRLWCWRICYWNWSLVEEFMFFERKERPRFECLKRAFEHWLWYWTFW